MTRSALCTLVIGVIASLAMNSAWASSLGVARHFVRSDAFGRFGSDAGSLRAPVGVALSRTGQIVVCDAKNNAVLRFDEDGHFVGAIDPGAVPFDTPEAVAVDSKNNVYVVEERANRVRRFDPKGAPLGGFGETGMEVGRFRSPRSIAIDGKDHIFVSDRDNLRIQEFDPSLRHVRNYRIARADRRPMAPWGVGVDPQGRLWATFPGWRKIVRFAANGEPDLTFGEENTNLGCFKDPRFLAFDVRGNVFVTDWRLGRVQKFSPEGEFLYSVGAPGSARSQFRGPQGVAIDVKGNLYVADTDNYRVQVLVINDRLAELNQAYTLFAANDIPAALDAYNALLQKIPLQREALDRVVQISEMLAEKALQGGKMEEAKPHLAEVLRLQPSNTKARRISRLITWEKNKGFVYYVTLGAGIFFTFLFLVATLVRILTSE